MNKYKLIAIIFVFTIGIIAIKTLWDNKQKFWDSIQFDNRIENINSIYDTYIAFKEEFIKLWSATQRTMGAELLDDVEYGHIIKDETGNLYFPADDVNVEEYAKQLIDFSNKVKEKNMNFTYIQAPNKVIEGYSSDMVFDYNFSNKNADEFLQILNENNVNTFDLRKVLPNCEIPVEKLFYQSDHHWTTPTAFWAYQKIVQYLNETYHFNIKEEYLQKDNYTSTELKKCFLGSLGRRVGAEVSGYDDYTFIEPKFSSSYELRNGITNQLISSGDFHHAIVKDDILNSTDPEANKHATYFEWDYGDLIIKNKTIDNHLKILLIKDSYALPVGAFLSTCVSEIHMVDLRDTPAVNLEKYIATNDFDAVIMLYNTEVFNSTMFNFSK